MPMNFSQAQCRNTASIGFDIVGLRANHHDHFYGTIHFVMFKQYAPYLMVIRRSKMGLCLVKNCPTAIFLEESMGEN